MPAKSPQDRCVEELYANEGEKRLVHPLPKMVRAADPGYLETATTNRPQRISRSTSAARAALAGALGGLAGTLAMNYAQRLWTLVVDGKPPQSAGGQHDARDWQEREESRNANELAVEAVAAGIAGRRLTRGELAFAAPLAHYSFGAAVGAIYGSLVHHDRRYAGRRGATFGAAVWLIADEVAMPLLRLSRPTTKRSPEKHLQSFVAHIVYGVVGEVVRARSIAVGS